MTRATGWRLAFCCAFAAAFGLQPAAAQDAQSKPPADQASPKPAAKGAASPHAAHPPAPTFRPLELAKDDPARANTRFDEHERNAERERAIVQRHGQDFHGQDVRYLQEYEWKVWRTGHWHHDFFNGRFGWWYEVAGVWYPYAAPSFPYPVTISTLLAQDVPAAPVDAAAEDADDGPVMAFAPLPGPPHFAYHCAKPVGFYPTVIGCETDWVARSAH